VPATREDRLGMARRIMREVVPLLG
jgi:hypothetical protein